MNPSFMENRNGQLDESRGSYLGDKGRRVAAIVLLLVIRKMAIRWSALCVVRVEGQVNNRVVAVQRQINNVIINGGWFDSTPVDTKNPARHELPATDALHEKLYKFIFMNARGLLRV
jgi:hypothetical protein